MPTVAIIVIIAVAILIIFAGLALGLAATKRRRRRQQLQPLSDAVRASFHAQWPAIQERFVDQPDMAVAQARQLVTSVLNERGHPAESYRQIAADLAGGYPQATAHFKSAHQLSHQLSKEAADGAAPTEDLRQALIHYRAMFDELVGGAPVRRGENARQPYEAGPAYPEVAAAETAEADVAAQADRDVADSAIQPEPASEAEEMRR